MALVIASQALHCSDAARLDADHLGVRLQRPDDHLDAPSVADPRLAVHAVPRQVREDGATVLLHWLPAEVEAHGRQHRLDATQCCDLGCGTGLLRSEGTQERKAAGLQLHVLGARPHGIQDQRDTAKAEYPFEAVGACLAQSLHCSTAAPSHVVRVGMRSQCCEHQLEATSGDDPGTSAVLLCQGHQGRTAEGLELRLVRESLHRLGHQLHCVQRHRPQAALVVAAFRFQEHIAAKPLRSNSCDVRPQSVDEQRDAT
mmetsp:Transcript_125850/g.350656  ORF Transcript_125850/g.350656 Transcript_125850/m.350656 type:complete len:257 (-) Transcript_125850:2550-3320(-)